jgi:signal transduction histidine kinase
MSFAATRVEDAMLPAAPALTVLHVDDEPVDQYRRRRALERAGFGVLDAASGASALAVIAAHAPDVVLLDVKLPDTNGFDLTREIKGWAFGADREIGVILISAFFTESEFRVRGLESGADAYLIEPIGDAELTASIRAVGRRVEQLKAARKNQWLLDRRTEELRLADQAKNDFLASVVHELRQPISAAVAALSVMKVRADRRRGEAAREVVERQMHQISRITDDLLDATRIVRGQVPLQIESRDLCPIARRSLETVAATAVERGIRLSSLIPADPVIALADESRIEQVLVNLLSNALRYTPAGGEVELLLEPSNVAAVVRVRDTGEGIAADQLSAIFELFVRGDRSQGLGIGLAVAKAIVDAHGGTIAARSAGPGTGSEFAIRLPRQQ